MIKNIKETPTKLVLYYISQQEYADPDLMESIRKECVEYKKQKYQPAIFISGNEPLEDCIYHLMKHNIKLMATHPERFKGSAKWVVSMAETTEV